MNIRKASLSDVPQLVTLINSAYRGDHSKIGWTTEADLLDGIRIDPESLENIIGNEHALILLISDEIDTPMGCVYLEKKNTHMYLGMLTVEPLLQSKGIGKLLLRASEGYALKQDCMVMEMTVISAREQLIAWYEKQGYYKTGDTKPFPADTRFGIPRQPLHFIVMQKDLGNLAVK